MNEHLDPRTEKLIAAEVERRVSERLAETQPQGSPVAGVEFRRLFDVLETLPALICLLSTDHRVVFANRSFRQKFGEPAGRNCYEQCFGLSEPCAFCESFKVLETGEPHHWEVTVPDGSVIDVHDFPFTDVDGTPMVLEMDIDITERKRAEEEMLKIQRLESIGLLAGGIAHDFNNILTAILGNITLARMFLPPGDKAVQRLKVAEKASMRALGLSQQLLTFAKGGDPIKKAIEVPPVVKEAMDFALRGSRVRTESSFPSDLRLVEADVSQLSQVVNNLAINAVQAMPEGGVLSVIAANEFLSPGNNLGLAVGEYVQINIKDQGVGIPEEELEKIFDPYYTTKELGSGLGLSIAFSVIKKHGGTITVNSTPGEGSTFAIFLPVSEKKSVLPPEEEPEELTTGKGRILVMDDEETVTDIAAEILQYLGYRAETVQDGTAAITAYRQALAAGKPFTAVIVDLTIPAGMGGKETVWHLLEIDPLAKVIVSSGHTNDPIMADYLAHGFKGAIPKPFRLSDLSKTLKEVLNGKE